MNIDRLKVLELWRACKIKPDRVNEVEQVCQKLLSFRALYAPVEAALKVPWYMVGALDYHEEDFRHGCYLGNGDSLFRPTRHVPKGRGPFNAWYDGAIDALKLEGFDKITHWDIVTVLIQTEIWNGLGYRRLGLPSPYIWGCTSVQRPGKYVADHVFNSTVWDRQIGCAAIFQHLRDAHGVDLNEA